MTAAPQDPAAPDAAAGRAAAMLQLVAELYPVNRSITGDGVRETLRRVAAVTPLDIHEIPTGTRLFDWEAPREWNVREAYVVAPDGRRIADVKAHSLHLMGYSVPVRRRMPLAELRQHLHSDPARPTVIPYRTSYYAENWGFCLPHERLLALPEGEYEVVIDATLAPGSMTLGEAVIPGATAEEVVVYTHTCHPALANDNLSGIAVCAELARWLRGRANRFTYRVVFGPGTIGSLAWLTLNRATLDRVRHGLVVVLAGNRAPLTYKQTRTGTADVDRVAGAYVANEEPGGTVLPFSAWGYDERQFGSPGFALPVGRLTRSTEEGYPEYHSSADEPGIVDGAALAGSLRACQTILRGLELNRAYRNTSPHGEPQLGRRGIYRSIGGPASAGLQKALLWMLSLSDGREDFAAIYARSGLPLADLARATELLLAVGLLVPVQPAATDGPGHGA
jgi:aminopeptidase-like protein